jgi:hypothetical protein
VPHALAVACKKNHLNSRCFVDLLVDLAMQYCRRRECAHQGGSEAEASVWGDAGSIAYSTSFQSTTKLGLPPSQKRDSKASKSKEMVIWRQKDAVKLLRDLERDAAMCLGRGVLVEVKDAKEVRSNGR